ncbi:hypothetical protein TeGR_g3907 [Tetraparma gracilis]|uniref:Endonuclease/exonuclease/phosphatase domain-containing protein n=1 Tax=Tetraparma gracilis TaxID=2962635 RepID=A0ABQ6M790_9STRA|nr:hypothetical protein TeGR_g3907 [Tetraparma gracilis]
MSCPALPGLRVLSYNVRFDCQCDPSFPEILLGNNDPEPWAERRERLADVIRDIGPDIVGIQEPKMWQVNYLSCELGMPWMGVGRESPRGDPVFLTLAILATVAAPFLLSHLPRLVRLLVRRPPVPAPPASASASAPPPPSPPILSGWRIICVLPLVSFQLYFFVSSFLPLATVPHTCAPLLTSFLSGPVTFAAVALSLLLLLFALSPLHSRPGLLGLAVLSLQLAYTACFSAMLVHTIAIPWTYGDEYSPILFDPSRNVSFAGNYNTTWLSRDQAPGRVASEWNAGCTRVATAATFAKDGHPFNFVNTHLDHVGDNARLGGAQVVARKIIGDTLKNLNDFPTVLTGDFNTYVGSPCWFELNNSLADTFFLSDAPHTGPLKSYNAFSQVPECGRSIDWVFVTRGAFFVSNHRSDFHEGSVSDHNPMWVDLVFNQTEGEGVEAGEGSVEGGGGGCGNEGQIMEQRERFERPFSDCARPAQ